MKNFIFCTALVFGLQLKAASGIFMVVKGDVKITAGTSAVTAKVGTKVNQGDLISTGDDARAKIVMSDRNIINISPNTKLKIEEYVSDNTTKNVKLSLLEGKVRNNVEQKYDNAKNKFQIRTPTAVAGVRGTQFITSYSNETKKTEVITLQGQVEFKNIVSENGSNKEQTVIIGKGEKSAVSASGAAPEPPQKVPPETLKQVDRDTSVKSKDGAGSATAISPQVSTGPNNQPRPDDSKSTLIDGANQNKFDKTKVKVVPTVPGN